MSRSQVWGCRLLPSTPRRIQGSPIRHLATCAKVEWKSLNCAKAQLVKECYVRAKKTLADASRAELQSCMQPSTSVEGTLDTIVEASLQLGADGMLVNSSTAYQVVRLAMLVSPSEWQRQLTDWRPPIVTDMDLKCETTLKGKQLRMRLAAPEEQFHSLVQTVRHLLLAYNAPTALLNSFSNQRGQPSCSAEPCVDLNDWFLSQKFALVLAAVGSGESAAKALKANISPKLTRQMAHIFMQTPDGIISPVCALRRAQVLSFGGSQSLAYWTCCSDLGHSIGSGEEENYWQHVLCWMCKWEDQLLEAITSKDPSFCPRASQAVTLSTVVNYLMRSESWHHGHKPSMKGKTVKSVLQAACLSKKSNRVWLYIYGHQPFPSSGLKPAEFQRADDAGSIYTARVEEIVNGAALLEVGRHMRNCVSAPYHHSYDEAYGGFSSFWVITHAYPDIRRGANVGHTLCKPVVVLMVAVSNAKKKVIEVGGPENIRPAQDAAVWRDLSEWLDLAGLDANGWCA